MVVALILLLVVVASVLFHLTSPWWFSPLASNWGYMDSTIIITFWITGVVFVAVILFVAYCVFRFRHREGIKAAYEPENAKLELWLTIGTAVGVAAMLAPGLVVWYDFVSVPKDAAKVEAVGKQWLWSYRLPGKDGVLGKSDTLNVSPDNPLGIDTKDPHGQDDIVIESDALHLPVGKPVKMLLRSTDVLHDFYVPQFRAKMDIVPGMVTYFWFAPTRAGSYEVLCAELCGIGHHTMRGTVVVEDEDAYQEWLKKQETFQQLSAQAANEQRDKLDLVSRGKRVGFTE